MKSMMFTLVVILNLPGGAAPARAGEPAAAPVGAAADGVELFESVRAGDAIPRTAARPGCTVVNTVRSSPEVLHGLAIGQRVVLTADPASGRLWTVDDIRHPAAGVRIVHCSLDGDPTGRVVLTTVGEATAMSMRIGSQHLVYRLQFLGNGVYEVWKLEANQREPERCFQAIPHAPVSPPHVVPPDDDDWVPGDDEAMPRDGGGCSSIPILDTMVVYTPAARMAMGGHSAIRAEAALAVELANEAYQFSLNVVRARLVYCNEIQYVEALTPDGDADMDTDLSRLSDESDGFMDSVHALRDTLNADLVVMYQDTGSGLGWCPSGSPPYDAGFSVVAWWRAAGTFTHAHETGHNLGCGHSREEGDGPCGPSYGLGWRFFGNDGNGYCTTMAYENASYDRILRYSNPNVTFQGMPTGNPVDDPLEAYNALVINANDNTVSGFELTRFDIYVNFAWDGLKLGTAPFPYNTVSQGVAQIDVPDVGASELPNLYITAGTTSWTGTINKAMAIRACSGTVRIGD